QQFKDSLTQGKVSTNLSPEKKALIDAYYAKQQAPQPISVAPAQQGQISTPNPNPVASAITGAGQQTGVNPGLLTKIATTETGLGPNAQNSTSTASGLFQFTDQTWKDMVNKYGKSLGVTENDKNDPEASALMGALFTRDNQQKLTDALKRSPTAGEL